MGRRRTSRRFLFESLSEPRMTVTVPPLTCVRGSAAFEGRTMRLLLSLLVLAAVSVFTVPAHADSKATIDNIEKLPRAGRLAAYEKALADKSVSTKERVELVKAFAKHAKDVSPAYSKGDFPFDVQNWIMLLQQ